MIKFDQMLSICKASRQNIWVVLMALVLGRQRMGYNLVELIRMILDYIMLEHHTHGLASCQ